MFKAYLGSTNPVKIQAVKLVLTDYNVIGLDVNSFVGAQPMNDEDTIKGAYNRAQQLPTDGIRIGLEAGIMQHDQIFYLVNWGVLIDEENRVYYAGGTRIPLPRNVVQKVLHENKELADVMEEETKINKIKHKEGAIGYYTNSLVKREDIFIHIMNLLYGQFLHHKEENK